MNRTGQEHKILAFEVDNITAEILPVNVSAATDIFPQISLADVFRPTGAVDILIGIQHAGLHPSGGNNKFFSGNLRLLHSKFGSGYILDGCHPNIRFVPPVLVVEDANRISHAQVGDTLYMKQSSQPHHTPQEAVQLPQM